jgi:type II secretory ATPase GspE/PulE/Tfp pilus assembly ATPase PilB-like protein
MLSAPTTKTTPQPVTSLFPMDWPLPHHMRVIDAEAGNRPEPADVALHEGALLAGVVLGIDFVAGRLDFQPESGPRQALAFAAIRTLFLTRVVVLERIPLEAPLGGVEARPSGERRKSTIVFKDDTSLDADVVSVVRRKAGYFLFVAHQGDEVQRWFVPSEAVANYRVGEPLGQALRERRVIEPEQLEAGLQLQRRLQTARLGDYLADMGIVTREQLEAALVRQKTMSHLRLGDALVQESLITAAQRDTALAMQAADRRKLLGEILVENGAVTREDIRRVLVEQLGVPSVTLSRFPQDDNAVKAVSAELARKFMVVPLYRTATRIAVGIENPLWWEALQELEVFTGLKVDPAMAPREELLAAIERFYGPGPALQDATPLPVVPLRVAVPVPAVQAVDTEGEGTLARFVNKMIVDAYDRGASDIHVESMPGDKPSRVRLRIDGSLTQYIEVPAGLRAGLVARLKLMGHLEVAERRRSQDGKINFADFGPRPVELRVVTMPTANGLEDVVMRIVAAPRALTLDQLALSPRILPELKAMAARASGLLIACGPTGSGKTTTLHSLLGHLNTAQRKIWTVEDPIEISQDGLCQVQVNPKLGLTFPEVLRSFLRADPDVIMVGEMRDTETARAVVAAALTGHLVMSTMRTESAVDTVVRVAEFGLDPFNFSDALLGVVGQRLVRCLCSACRVPHAATGAEIDALAHEYARDAGVADADVAARWRSRYGSSDGTLTLHTAAGCPACDGTGYKGRMGVYELLVATPAIRERIRAGANAAELRREAIAGGMVTLQQDAIDKILRGELDLPSVRNACL